MPRFKVVGSEKCPHIDKKSGNSDCQKLGRYSPKPMISWNNKRKFDKKREYQQFIHNDGTIHNLGKFRDFQLNQMKGSSLQEFFKYTIEMHERFYELGRMFEIIAYRDLSKMKLNDREINLLRDGVNYHALSLVKISRSVELMKDSINYIRQNAKQPPKEMTFELREITKFLKNRQTLLDNNIDPLVASLNEIYDKYIMPKRKKKKKIINKRISESKGGIPKSTSLPI